MKIFANYGLKKTFTALAAVSILSAAPCAIHSQNRLKRDSIYDEFVKKTDSTVTQGATKPIEINTPQVEITPQGTVDRNFLTSAPSPNVVICGKKLKAAIVIDLANNVLYTYDNTGDATAAYLVASGKKSSPTQTGIRVVSHIESYPYKSAPECTRRRKHPRDYGPKIICLNKIDSKTGIQSSTGQFIHGNGNPKSIGNYVSLGCVRMDNEVIKQLAKQVKRGDIVVIKK